MRRRRPGSHLDLIGDKRKLSHPEKRLRVTCQKWSMKGGRRKTVSFK